MPLHLNAELHHDAALDAVVERVLLQYPLDAQSLVNSPLISNRDRALVLTAMRLGWSKLQPSDVIALRSSSWLGDGRDASRVEILALASSTVVTFCDLAEALKVHVSRYPADNLAWYLLHVACASLGLEGRASLVANLAAAREREPDECSVFRLLLESWNRAECGDVEGSLQLIALPSPAMSDAPYLLHHGYHHHRERIDRDQSGSGWSEHLAFHWRYANGPSPTRDLGPPHFKSIQDWVDRVTLEMYAWKRESSIQEQLMYSFQQLADPTAPLYPIARAWRELLASISNRPFHTARAAAGLHETATAEALESVSCYLHAGRVPAADDVVKLGSNSLERSIFLEVARSIHG